MSKYILLILVFLIGSAGQIMLKLGVNESMARLGGFRSLGQIIKNAFILMKNPLILLALFSYAVGFIIWLFILTKFQLSYVFPLMAAVYIAVLLGSWIFLKEDISTLRILGTIIVTLGIILVAKS